MGIFSEEIKRAWSEKYPVAKPNDSLASDEPNNVPASDNSRHEIMILMSEINMKDQIISKHVDEITSLTRDNKNLFDRLIESEANLLSVRKEKGLYWDAQKANAPYRQNPYLKYAIYDYASNEINGRLDDSDE